jgi:hypothetical protein
MTAAEDDPLDRALASIHDLEWDNDAHREALAHEIDRRTRAGRRRGRPRLAFLAVSLVLLGGLALAAEGPLRRWLSVWIDGIERNPAGEIESMTLRTEEGTSAQLVPIEKSPGAFDPAIDEKAPTVSVSSRDGGTARIRVLRRGRNWHETFYKAVGVTTLPARGDRFTVETVRLASITVARRDDVVEIRHTFEDGQVIDFVLHSLPDNPRRFGDGETLVEWIAP